MELINFFSWRPNISLKLHALTTSQPFLYFVVQWVFTLVSTNQPMNDWGLGPVSQKSRNLSGLKNPELVGSIFTIRFTSSPCRDFKPSNFAVL